MKRLLYLTTLSIVAALILVPAALAQIRGPSGADGTYNCEDFDDQGQAQEFFIGAGGPAADPNSLDEDGNGIACESLLTATDPNAPGVGTDQYTTTEETAGAGTDQYTTTEETTATETTTEGTTGEETVGEETAGGETTAEETIGGGGTEEEKTRRERRERQDKTGGEGTGGGAGETTGQNGGTTGSNNGGEGGSADGSGKGAEGYQGGLALAVNDGLGNISRGRLPSTGGGWAVLLIAGAVLIGGGWLLVRRFSSS